MKIGVVFPQTEIGQDPAMIRDYAQAVESMGYTHILAFDSVVGASPDRPGGWDSPYTYEHAFHEPFVLFGFCAGVTRRIELVTGIIILPQRQTVLVAKQAAQVDVLSGGTAAPRHRRGLEHRRVRGPRRELQESRPAGGGAARGDAASLDPGAGDLRGTVAPVFPAPRST
jgi:Luciferase-like monooxygenase